MTCGHKMLHKLMDGVDDSFDHLKTLLFLFFFQLLFKGLQKIKPDLCLTFTPVIPLGIFKL